MKYPNGWFKNKACRRCSAIFEPTAPSQHYCSRSCRGRNAYYLRNYGIDEDGLATMKLEQNNLCFICEWKGFRLGTHNKEVLAVDHCHATGKVRKLLCHNCNRALGLMKDDPNLLRKAATYIETHREGATTIP